MEKKGLAGNQGDRIRSDCWVELEITSSGGQKISLDSKVGRLYGTSIRELLKNILAHFGIDHAKVRLDDSGALEFVLAARLEAAIKQVLETDLDFIPSPGIDIRGRSDRSRFRFTRLYLPGNTPSMMINAGIHQSDGIILDLEDSVAPDKKDEARILVRNALTSVDYYGAEKMVRINQLPLGLSDLDSIIHQGPDLVLVPKVEFADQVREVDTRIRDLAGAQKKRNPVWIMPIIESAMGIENAFEIARSSENIVAMAIGLEDYTADMGVARTEEGTESLYARTRLVNACKAANIQAIDSVYSDVGNESGLRDSVRNSKILGFEGMGCIHPRQVPVIREEFKPSGEEIEKAINIMLAFERAEKEGLGVVSLGTKMIDPPVVKRAQRTIHLALQMKMIPKNWRKKYE